MPLIIYSTVYVKKDIKVLNYATKSNSFSKNIKMDILFKCVMFRLF